MQVFSHKVDAVSVALKLQFKNYWKLNAISRDISRVSNLLTNCNFNCSKSFHEENHHVKLSTGEILPFSCFINSYCWWNKEVEVIIIITILWLLLFVMHRKSCGKTRSAMLFLACMVLTSMAFLSFSDSFQRAYNLWWGKPIFFYLCYG